MLVGLRSRRHITPFSLHRPASLTEAISLAAVPGASAYLAGGLDLIDRMKYGTRYDRLIRLDGIAGLRAIERTGDALRIGALVTHQDLADSPIVADALPDMARAWQLIANPRVRVIGTIGGNIMAARGEYEALPAMMALGAEAEVTGADGLPHRVAVDRLGEQEQPVLLTALIVPVARRLFVDRSLRPVIGVALGVDILDGKVTALRASTSATHIAPFCVNTALALPLAGLGRLAGDIARESAARLPEPISDTLASSSYRRRMAEVLIRRLIIRAGMEA